MDHRTIGDDRSSVARNDTTIVGHKACVEVGATHLVASVSIGCVQPVMRSTSYAVMRGQGRGSQQGDETRHLRHRWHSRPQASRCALRWAVRCGPSWEVWSRPRSCRLSRHAPRRARCVPRARADRIGALAAQGVGCGVPVRQLSHGCHGQDDGDQVTGGQAAKTCRSLDGRLRIGGRI